MLLLKSPRVEVHRSPCPVIDYTDFSHPLLEEYDIIVNATPLYTSVQEELGAAREVFVRMSARLSWSRVAAAVVREAQDLFTSRVYAYEGQKETKGVGVYMVRKSRHFGVATLLDTLKETSIDADIRQLSDYVLFKGVGVWGLPAAFKWVYAYVDPPSLATLPKNRCVVVPRNTALGYGAVPYVAWHKKEPENIVAAAGIEVEKPPEDGFTPQKAAGIDAETHVGIVESYALGMSMAATALKYGVSSATVKSHVWRHNDAVARETRCGICAAEGSALAGEAVNVRR